MHEVLIIAGALIVVAVIIGMVSKDKSTQDPLGGFPKHIEKIKCPACNHIQDAEVIETQPYFIYVHTCDRCKYLIMESEWHCIS